MSDEFTDKFREMKDRMNPSPELLARVAEALEDSQGPSHSVEADHVVETGHRVYSLPTTPVKNVKPSVKPRAKIRRGMGALLGGGTGVVLAAVMTVGMLAGNFSGSHSREPAAPAAGPVAGGYSDEYLGIYSLLQASTTYYPRTETEEWAPVPASESDVIFASTDSVPTGLSLDTGKTSFSGTNTQVAGVDEGDIIKTDGSNLYISSGGSVKVVSTAGAESVQIASVVPFAADSSILDLMIFGKTLVVVTEKSEILRDTELWHSVVSTNFYDITDPSNPTAITAITQSGNYTTSRLVDKVLYLVSGEYVDVSHAVATDPATYVPVVGTYDGTRVVPADKVAILPWVEEPVYSVVTAIDVETRQVLSEQAILGRADTVYMSLDNLYVATTGYPWAPSSDGTLESGVDLPGFSKDCARTAIVRVGLNGGKMSVAAQSAVGGYLLNQFSLDESDGYLRVVTEYETEDYQQAVGLWVLNSALEPVGSIASLVKDESVQSVRFSGAVAYVVTFERVDPLFTIDLSDPSSPKVQSALKIPGFSSYLHPFGNGLLLGIGEDGTMDGLTGGLKMSMFDVSDPFNVSETAITKVDAYYTEVAYDHKAAFVDSSRGIIGFPTMTESEIPVDLPTPEVTVDPSTPSAIDEPTGMPAGETMVPDVYGMSYEEALVELARQGFVEITRYDKNDPTSGDGSFPTSGDGSFVDVVTYQDPSAGTVIAKDTRIILGVTYTSDTSNEPVSPTSKVSSFPSADPSSNQTIEPGTIPTFLSERDTPQDTDWATTDPNMFGYDTIWNYRLYSWNGSRFDSLAVVPLFENAHDRTEVSPLASWAPSSDTSWARGICVDDFFYIITPSQVLVHTMSNYAQVASVNLV